MRLLIIYAFCTFGGVERVILNRIEAFRKFGLNIKIDMVFLQDLGGFNSFREYIKLYDLSKYIDVSVFNGDFTTMFRLDEYDLVFNIDTPSVFEHFKMCKNFYIECHTPYRENRIYLKSLPENVRAVIVPSDAFRDEIKSEIPDSMEIYVLPNSVSEIFFTTDNSEQKIHFKKRPIAFMARLDELKNINETLKIFKKLNSVDDAMYSIIGKGATEKNFINTLKNSGLLSKTFVRSKIHFDQVPQFLHLIRAHKGIFISSSKGESFGMAVAECIACSVPIVVSDIPPHRALLGSNRNFLYRLGDINEAVKKVKAILNNWNYYSQEIGGYAEPLKHHSFIAAWEKIFSLSNKNKNNTPKQKDFERAVYQYYEHGKGSTMYDTYISYALSTNTRGESLVNNLSYYISLKNKSYLDIGTAYGGYLVAYGRHGCKPCYGIDIDEKLLQICKINLKENNQDPNCVFHADICEYDSLPTTLQKRKFDIITCTDVLEHVSNVSQALENIKSLMSGRGVLYLEIPNRYHVNHVISDPHFGIFGITLLDRDDAIKYFNSLRGGNYSVGDYYELDYILSFFPQKEFKVKIIPENINFKELDTLFKTNIAMAYQDKIDSLSVPFEIRDKLVEKFRDYIFRYNKQMDKRNNEYFYIQTWRVLIYKETRDELF